MKKIIKRLIVVLLLLSCVFYTSCELLDQFLEDPVEENPNENKPQEDDKDKKIEEELVHISFDGVEKQTVSKGGKALAIKAEEKEGYTFIAWTLDGVDFDFNTTLEKDINLISKYKINEYKVSFKNGNDIEEKIVEYGSKVSRPEDPIKEGETFTGWYCGSKEFDFNTEIKSNYTLTAHFSTQFFEVVFDNDGVKETKNVEYGQTVSPIVGTKTGYTLVGWTYNNNLFDFNTVITENITLVAKYEINKYTITFNVKGSKYESVQTEYNAKVSKPKVDPTSTGETFVGWYLNNKEFDFNTLITNELVLEAKFSTNTYTVTFDNEGAKTTKNVAHGNAITKIVDPSKTGYTFNGWLLNDKLFDFNTKITSDITLVASFTINQYTVTFKVENTTYKTSTVNYNAKVQKPNENPTKTGYTFNVWTLDGASYDFNKAITKDITLVATFNVNTYVVTFEANGSTFETKTVEYNQKVSITNTPSKDGYTFNKWTLNNNEFDFDTLITSDITLVATFTQNTYQIVYVVDNETYTTQTVAANQFTSKPSDPVKNGYTFNYWMKDTSEFSFNTKITENITLIAKFTQNESGVINVQYDFGYDCYQTKNDLRLAYYTDFYNFICTKGGGQFTQSAGGSSFTVTDLASFLEFVDTWQVGTQKEMGFIGNALGKYYLTKDQDGVPEDQPTDYFIGWCWQNNKYRAFISHLIEFFAYWRTDEGYTTSTNHGNDFFYDSWAAMVDTAKFFHFTSDNITNTYSWFTKQKSPRVHYALDHIPGVGYVTLTYTSSTPIALPTDVTRVGGEFLGWVDSNNNPVTVVNHSMTVYATWTTTPIYTIRAEATTNGISGSETNWYCATPSQTNYSYLYGHRLIIAQTASGYVVSEILAGEGASPSGNYAYRIVHYEGGAYQTFDSVIQVGQKVTITQDGNYLIFKFYE